MWARTPSWGQVRAASRPAIWAGCAALSLVLCACGGSTNRRPLPLLADQYNASSAAPYAGGTPNAEAPRVVADGELRHHTVVAPSGKAYRLRWRKQAESVGKPAAGSLEDGAKLPDNGVGFRHIGEHPYGTEETVTYTQFAAWVVAKQFPGTVALVVGDISRDGGGRLPPHRSHRSGRDVDIGWYAVKNKRLRWFKTLDEDQMDLAKTWTFVEALLRTGAVQYIFIDKSIQEWLYRHAAGEGWDDETLKRLFQYPGRNKRTIIRHVRGHRNHMHVRFRCPADDGECEG